ncbi:hypothetical protein A2U01_0015808, partial [Trifolium medium]|nr:hypothetical protein [Trifolium medium]
MESVDYAMPKFKEGKISPLLFQLWLMRCVFVLDDENGGEVQFACFLVEGSTFQPR